MTAACCLVALVGSSLLLVVQLYVGSISRPCRVQRRALGASEWYDTVGTSTSTGFHSWALLQCAALREVRYCRRRTHGRTSSSRECLSSVCFWSLPLCHRSDLHLSRSKFFTVSTWFGGATDLLNFRLICEHPCSIHECSPVGRLWLMPNYVVRLRSYSNRSNI